MIFIRVFCAALVTVCSVTNCFLFSLAIYFGFDDALFLVEDNIEVFIFIYCEIS